jgi:hypothetical protein
MEGLGRIERADGDVISVRTPYTNEKSGAARTSAKDARGPAKPTARFARR